MLFGGCSPGNHGENRHNVGPLCSVVTSSKAENDPGLVWPSAPKGGPAWCANHDQLVQPHESRPSEAPDSLIIDRWRGK